MNELERREVFEQVRGQACMKAVVSAFQVVRTGGCGSQQALQLVET